MYLDFAFRYDLRFLYKEVENQTFNIMSEVQLLLSWDQHQKNICNGLSQLQQYGEFVDMTLAADGHHVKVHQLVMSLASPYIKALISSANCPHPVIFLNNVSYTTLCSILEYIYTGQVLLNRDKLGEVIAAGKALHIRGLEEKHEQEIEQDEDPIATSNISPPTKKTITAESKEHREQKKNFRKLVGSLTAQPICKIYLDEDDSNETATVNRLQDSEKTINSSNNKTDKSIPELTRKALCNPNLQYSVSNQGGIQAIHLRYIYRLQYISKKYPVRMWRCIDYSSNLKCPATISTNENNKVTSRSCKHNHPYHDRKIQQKVRSSRIYSGFSVAESLSKRKQKERHCPTSINENKTIE